MLAIRVGTGKQKSLLKWSIPLDDIILRIWTITLWAFYFFYHGLP